MKWQCRLEGLNGQPMVLLADLFCSSDSNKIASIELELLTSDDKLPHTSEPHSLFYISQTITWQ